MHTHDKLDGAVCKCMDCAAARHKRRQREQPSASDIALNAREQALVAAEVERQRIRAEEDERARQRQEQHRLDYEAARPILAEWFPGVMWRWNTCGPYDEDTILWDESESWPPSFKLCVRRFFREGNESVEIRVGDYVNDTSMPGHQYFAGGHIKSAADVGRYLESKR